MDDSTRSQYILQSGPQESINSHHATQARSYRVPSLPNIMVPPPIFTTEDISKGRLRTYPSSLYSGSDLEALPVLESINYMEFFAANKIHEWKYTLRRQAQKILPFLYLGPLSSARDKAFLSQEGVTLLLAVRNTMSAQAKVLDGTRISNEMGIESCSVDVAGNHMLMSAFPRAVQIINAHVSKIYRRQAQTSNLGHQTMPGDGELSLGSGKVLVYCETGNERSAGIVAAYVLTMYDITPVHAIQLIQMQRLCVAFDESAKNALRNYAEILAAKRDVLKASSGQTATPWNICTDRQGAMIARRTKRTLDERDGTNDAEMEDADAAGNDEEAILSRRAGYAPFQECSSV